MPRVFVSIPGTHMTLNNTLQIAVSRPCINIRNNKEARRVNQFIYYFQPLFNFDVHFNKPA